jgi:hypothetical protein
VAGGAWRLAIWTGDVEYGGDPSLSSPPERIEGGAELELAGWGAAVYVSEV